MGPRTNIGAYATDGGTVNVTGGVTATQTNDARSPRRQPRPRRRADVGVLTVLTEELRAVVQVLQGHRNYRSVLLASGAQAHEADVSTGARSLHVVAVQALAPGQRSAAVAFQQLQAAYRPTVVLLVGIAGAIRADLRIGDVVIADEVVYYDSRRETPQGPRRRGQSHPMAPVLRHRVNELFRRYGPAVAVGQDDMVRLYRGPVGSGDAVVTDSRSAIVEDLRRFNEKTLAVETEAGAVGQVFYEQIDEERSLRGWLTIRGISDLADEHKGYDHHEFAAERAALVMDRLLPLLDLSIVDEAGEAAS